MFFFIKRKNKSRGQSIVEWAIILPMLALILISIIELAPMMNTMLKVEKASQYGARIGAIHGNTNDDIKDGVLFNLQGLVKTDGLQYINCYQQSGQVTKTCAYRETTDGVERTLIEILPGQIEERINGGWVMVKTKYNYKIYTPLLRGVLNKSGLLDNDMYFPIVRYAIYRIE